MTRIHPRLARERKTVEAMIRIFCADRHGTPPQLCPECSELMAYAGKRLDKCPYGKDKPMCANCSVHCYRPDMQQRIREVMRYSGPRMIWSHPFLAAFHLLDGRRKAPAWTAPKERDGK